MELTERLLWEVGRISLSLRSRLLMTPLQHCFGSDLHFGPAGAFEQKYTVSI